MLRFTVIEYALLNLQLQEEGKCYSKSKYWKWMKDAVEVPMHIGFSDESFRGSFENFR